MAAPRRLSHLSRVRWSVDTFWIGALIACALAGGIASEFGAAPYLVVASALLISGILLYLRQYEIIVVCIVAIAVFLDWFHLISLPFYFPFIAIATALLFIGVIFFIQSDTHPWIPPTHLGLWGLILVGAALAILPASDRIDATSYYLHVFVVSALMFALGRLITLSVDHLRKLVIYLSHLGAFIGLHTIVIGLTGIFLFSTAGSAEYLGENSGFRLTVASASRAGSFLGNPDWDGIFLATMLFLPLGAALSETALWRRLIYIFETALILGGLLFTFATGSWISIAAGGVVFIALAGSRRLRVSSAALIAAALVAGVIVFRNQALILLRHTVQPTGLGLRLGGWLTAIKVILAYPLTGIGLGYTAYLAGAEPFRDPAVQYRPLAQPHNTYLELAAMAGLPVLLLFLIVLGKQVRPLLATYGSANTRAKPLIGGAIAAVAVLAINSLTIPGWTVEPLACLGWLLLGSLSSPCLSTAGMGTRPAFARLGLASVLAWLASAGACASRPKRTLDRRKTDNQEDRVGI